MFAYIYVYISFITVVRFKNVNNIRFDWQKQELHHKNNQKNAQLFLMAAV